MSLHTFGFSSAPVEVWYTSSAFTPAPPPPVPPLRRSISPSCPLSHTSLPITPSVYLSPRPRLFILPVYSDGDHAVAKATGAIVYPVARWLVAVAMIKNSEAPPPPLPLLLLLPSIDKSSQFFSSFCCPSLPPSLLLTTLLEEKHADL